MMNSSNRVAAAKLLFGMLVLLSVFIPRSTNAAGVTVITHGYDGDVTGWITAMADEIPTYYHYYNPALSTNLTIYTITLTYSNSTSSYYYHPQRESGGSPLSTDTGEIIVKLDWSDLAGSPNPLSTVFDESTYDVAAVASYVLLQTNTIPDLNGRPLVEFPIHLIGHSRGGSLVSEISRQLGTNGVWVDHVTTLDPHPLNNDGNLDLGFPTDAPAKDTYANVLFADDYWQNLGGFLDPLGEPVSGAYVRQLSVLSGGYFNTSSISPDHSNVHLWYYGSIDLHVPTSYNDDGVIVSLDATMRTNWWVDYEVQGSHSGFYYSLIGGGNRLSTDMPRGAGFPAIVDGYNQWWDFGAGTSANRTPLPANNGTWPNIIKFDVIGTNVVAKGQAISTKFYYQYGGASSNVTAEFYFAGDFNPYNTNSRSITQISLPNTGVNSVFYKSVNLTTTNIPPGGYAIYGKLSDGVHTRYLYTPELVTIFSSPQPPILGISKLNSTQLRIVVGGVSSQTIVLQTSTDLQNWLPLATNTLTTSSWNYTNNTPPNFSNQFYRALLFP